MISLADIDAALLDGVRRGVTSAAFVAPLRDSIARGTDVRQRSALPGHVTCGALILSPAGKLLLVRHNALGRWLTPGGHLEADDESLYAAALREVREEVGLRADQLWTPAHTLAAPAQIDRHPIPANARKGEAAHDHWDFRFLFLLRDAEALTLQTDEISAARWADPAEADDSIARLLIPMLRR
ncbi:MAG TPA: NUDIX domain-containing protein [Tepidisphaeraceae bacterium]|jgi:8-oxo-dGTP pyrophosphatase MutT (NUDIX family)